MKPRREYYQDMVRHATVREVDKIKVALQALETQATIEARCKCMRDQNVKSRAS